MSKGTIFYVIGFILIAFPMMIDRYVMDIPNLLSYGPAIAGFICVYIGMKIKGEKINWNFDFNPSGTTAQSRRKAQQSSQNDSRGK